MFKKCREIKELFILLNKNFDRNSFSQAIFRQIILKLAKVLFLGRNFHYGQISVNLTILLMLADNFTVKDVHFTNFLSKCNDTHHFYRCRKNVTSQELVSRNFSYLKAILLFFFGLIWKYWANQDFSVLTLSKNRMLIGFSLNMEDTSRNFSC